MIGMCEFYIILHQREVTPSVEQLMAIARAAGSRIDRSGDSWTWHNASQLDQDSTMGAIQIAWNADREPSNDLDDVMAGEDMMPVVEG